MLFEIYFKHAKYINNIIFSIRSQKYCYCNYIYK